MSDKTKLFSGLGGVVTFPRKPTHQSVVKDGTAARSASLSSHLWLLDVLGALKGHADAQRFVQLSAALVNCGETALNELRAQEFGHSGPSPEDA